jgi:hypothetical protein
MPDRQDDLNPASDLAPFADALQRLAPQPPHLSRDALLFEAGKAAASPWLAPWVWPSAAGLFAALALVFALFLIAPSTPETQYVERTVYVYREQPSELPPPSAEPERVQVTAKNENPPQSDESNELAQMYRQKRDVLRWGIDMLPESKPAARSRAADETVVKHWLKLPPGMFAVPSLQPKKPATKSEVGTE